MAKTLIAHEIVTSQQQPMTMPSSISSSPFQRKTPIYTVSGSGQPLDDGYNSDSDKGVDQHEDPYLELEDEEEEGSPIHHISVITVIDGAPDTSISGLYSESCFDPKLDVNGSKHKSSVDKRDNVTQRTFAAASKMGYMCSQVVPQIDVGASACAAMMPLGRSPLHEDAPYQHLAAAAAARDYEIFPTSPVTYKYQSTPLAREGLHSNGSNIANRPPSLSSTGRAVTMGTISSSSTIRSTAHIRTTPITFKAGTSGLRALARNGREHKVERFNYAKALLRSDDELEKLAQKIRAEINESELFELALAAEKAAEAGEDKFTGRASTFGTSEQHSTPGTSVATANVSTPVFGPSKTPATPPQSKPVRNTGTSAPITPTETPVPPLPRVPLRMDVGGSSASKLFPTAGPGGSAIHPSTVRERSISEPHLSTLSILDSAILVIPPHQPHQPEKRSMRIHSLRDVSEVIPHFKELHAHMRTHLYREQVEVKALFFKEWQPSPPVDNSLGWGRFRHGRTLPKDITTPGTDGNGNKSDHVQVPANATRQHRRWRSFFDDISQMRPPGFGQRQVQDGKYSSLSFDKTISDGTTQGSTPGVSHKQLLGKKLPSHLQTDEPKQLLLSSAVPTETTLPDEMKGDIQENVNAKTKGQVLTTSAGGEEDSSMRVFTFGDEGKRPSLLPRQMLNRLEPFDLEELKATIPVETIQSMQNCSVCSSDTTSLDSTDGEDEDEDHRDNVLHGGYRTECIFTETGLSGTRSLVSSPQHAASKNVTSSPLPNELGAGQSVSLLDDGSACPTSPLYESSLENFIYQSYPRLEEADVPRAPLTPKDMPPRAESEFNTPAHLRVIKRLHRNVSDEINEKLYTFDHQRGHEQLQPRPEQLRQLHSDETFISTPAMKVGIPLEPNSIVDHSSGARSDNRIHERDTAQSRYEAETQYLALPTIHSAASDLTLGQVSQKFVRRTLRTHWPIGPNASAEFPAAATLVSNPIASMKPMQNRDNLVTLSSQEKPRFVREGLPNEDLEDRKSDKDEKPSHGCDLSGRTEVRSYVDQTDDIPVRLFHRSEVGEDAASSAFAEGDRPLPHIGADIFHDPVEEKKECDNDALLFSKEHDILPTEAEQSALLELSNDRPDPSFLQEDSGCSQSFLQIDLDSSILSRVDGEKQEKDNEVIPVPPLKESTTSAANDSFQTGSHSIEPATETWNDPQAADLDVRMTNSILTGSNENSVAVTFTEMSSDSQDFVARSYARCSAVGRQLVGSPGHQSLCHSLPSTDENFKAALEGVLSHLSLSPRGDRLPPSVFLPEAENKEYLANYFYCTKKESLPPQQGEGGGDSRVGGGDGIGLSCVEPCNAHDTQCYLYGVDAMCSGLAYLFPIGTSAPSREMSDGGGGGSVRRGSFHNCGSEGLYPTSAARERLGTKDHPLLQQLHADIDWEHQHQQQQDNSWLGMFQKAASQRFKFQFHSSDYELERSRHPFNPPCLSRRVVRPSHERTTSLHHGDGDVVNGNQQL